VDVEEEESTRFAALLRSVTFKYKLWLLSLPLTLLLLLLLLLPPLPFPKSMLAFI
jgi:hypothetical protein